VGKRLTQDQSPGNGVPACLFPAPRNRGDVGFVLLDPAKKVVFVNKEVIQLLNYPNDSIKPGASALSYKLLREKLGPLLETDGSSSQFRSVNEFQSGRRRYLCRVFGAVPRSRHPAQQQTIALLFERASSPAFDMDKVREKYHLTAREQEALQYLVRGLTSKEIASRMQVSPNTVKAFLRSVMIKMGSHNRAAIMSKVMGFRP
jgi:DNA-binding CsgD family transcriptional regulator